MVNVCNQIRHKNGIKTPHSLLAAKAMHLILCFNKAIIAMYLNEKHFVGFLPRKYLIPLPKRLELSIYKVNWE